MKVRVLIKNDGTTEIAAYDLVGDSWRDYLDHIKAAMAAQDRNNQRLINTSIRASLVSLHAHLEGVTSGLDRVLQKNEKNYCPRQPPNGRFRCTRDIILDLRHHADRQMGQRLPYLRLRSKALRDIIVHPTITKNDPDNRGVSLCDLNLYALNIEAVRADGRQIEKWLIRLCRIYGYTRIHDTKTMVASLSTRLGGNLADIQEI